MRQIVKIELDGTKMVAVGLDGQEVSGILYGTRKRALENQKVLENVNGKWKAILQWYQMVFQRSNKK